MMKLKTYHLFSPFKLKNVWGCHQFIKKSTAVPAVTGFAIATATAKPWLPLHIRQPFSSSNTIGHYASVCINSITVKRVKFFVTLFILFFSIKSSAQEDTSKTLNKVTIATIKYKNQYEAAVPTQLLSNTMLQKLNAPTVGDAAKYFSGVLVKDYGGIGGLKTVSVRSLGASHTGIAYDGIAVSDVQAGQIDLSRFSSAYVQALVLEQGLPQTLLQPARLLSSASLLSIHTPSYYPAALLGTKWKAGVHAGSFAHWQPFATVQLPVSKNTIISVNTEALFSKGNYPYKAVNGNNIQDKKRDNSDINSLQAEINVNTVLKDSAVLQVKGWGYSSERGLPGVVIFNIDRSVQRLWNKDFFIQTRYTKTLSSRTNLLLAAKYNYAYTRYTDPDFLNNQGGLDDRYTQTEAYASAAVSQQLLSGLQMSFASDIAYAVLKANTNVKGKPDRVSWWNALSLSYKQKLWNINGSVLWHHFNDRTEQVIAAGTTNKLTPAIAAGFKWSEESPFMLRAFYKHIFRMPTFNDLYYNFIGYRDLKPELAKQINAGITYSKKFEGYITGLNMSTDGYINNIKDKIVAIPSQNMFIWTMMNLGKVRITGVDVNTDVQGKVNTALSWMLRLAYTWQKALDVTDKTQSSYKHFIPYTPEHSGSGMFSASYKEWTVGYNILFSGTRYAQRENHPTNELNGWGVHDVFVAKNIKYKNYNCLLKAELNNITAQAYDVVRNYPMPGRSFKISLVINNL